MDEATQHRGQQHQEGRVLVPARRHQIGAQALVENQIGDQADEP